MLAIKKYIFWSFVVALAGFLFGFDTVVISGAEQQIKEVWPTSDWFHGFVIVGSALWGTVLGALTGSVPTDKLGRKNTLVLIGFLYLVSALGSAFAPDPFFFSFFRFIGGIGIGVSTIAAPAYISEIAPSNVRGRLVATYQLAIVVGILGAMLSNYLLKSNDTNAWRWMMGVEAIPAVLYGISVCLVPKSPRWLILNNKDEKASEILDKIGVKDKRKFAEGIRKQDLRAKGNIFSPKYKRSVLLAIAIAFFNQLSGINAILYYAPRIFDEAGLTESTAMLSSVGVGLVNLIFTVIAMLVIDRSGRKNLMFIGSIGYIVSLLIIALAMFMGFGGLLVVIFIFLFIASHAIGQGAVIWVFLAEIFPTEVRAKGQVIGSGVHWFLAALIPSSIPILFAQIHPGAVFLIFGIAMIGQLLWVKLAMPETKGISLEEMENALSDQSTNS